MGSLHYNNEIHVIFMAIFGFYTERMFVIVAYCIQNLNKLKGLFSVLVGDKQWVLWYAMWLLLLV